MVIPKTKLPWFVEKHTNVTIIQTKYCNCNFLFRFYSPQVYIGYDKKICFYFGKYYSGALLKKLLFAVIDYQHLKD